MTDEIVLDFTKEDLAQLPNTLSIIHQVAAGPDGSGVNGHLGLGVHVAFKKAIEAAGEACLTVGILGVGKTKSLEALYYITGNRWYDQDFATLAGISPSDQKYLSESKATWITYDLSRVSEMAIDNTLKLICGLLTDNDHSVHAKTSGYEVNITHCDLSWLGACDYTLYNILWTSPRWIGNFRDRIFKYHQAAFAMKEDINTKTPCPRITLNFPPIDSVRLEDKEGFRLVRKMLRSQFSDERSYLWAMKLGQANAALNHRDYTTWADWKFLLLYRFNLELERTVGSRETFTSHMKLDADALDIFSRVCKYGGASREFLMEDSQMYDEEYARQKINQYMGKLWEEDPATGKLEVEECMFNDFVLPQIKFEKFAFKHGKEYYNFDPTTVEWKAPLRPSREEAIDITGKGKKI